MPRCGAEKVACRKNLWISVGSIVQILDFGTQEFRFFGVFLVEPRDGWPHDALARTIA
jgi:hypothetical protein